MNSPHSLTERLTSNSGAGDTLTNIVAQRLAADIVDGSIPPGTKLKFAELRQRYAVGSSPLREALVGLVSQGFVESSCRRGFRVSAMSQEDLADLTAARILVEGMALRQAIVRGDNRWEDGIVGAFAPLKRAIERAKTGQGGGWQEIEVAHKRFHLTLTAACSSRRLLALQETYYDQAKRYRQLMTRMIEDLDQFLESHERLMDLILARDVEAAAAQLILHIGIVLQEVYGATPRARAG
jgi:GntR family carbon starvation induced transcriptional regulator